MKISSRTLVVIFIPILLLRK